MSLASCRSTDNGNNSYYNDSDTTNNDSGPLLGPIVEMTRNVRSFSLPPRLEKLSSFSFGREGCVNKVSQHQRHTREVRSEHGLADGNHCSFIHRSTESLIPRDETRADDTYVQTMSPNEVGGSGFHSI